MEITNEKKYETESLATADDKVNIRVRNEGWQETAEVLGQKSTPRLFCPPQILRERKL
jgi:hypothetical protein